jgi:hypothetical protein
LGLQQCGPRYDADVYATLRLLQGLFGRNQCVLRGLELEPEPFANEIALADDGRLQFIARRCGCRANLFNVESNPGSDASMSRSCRSAASKLSRPAVPVSNLR